MQRLTICAAAQEWHRRLAGVSRWYGKLWVAAHRRDACATFINLFRLQLNGIVLARINHERPNNSLNVLHDKSFATLRNMLTAQIEGTRPVGYCPRFMQNDRADNYRPGRSVCDYKIVCGKSVVVVDGDDAPL